MTHPSSPYKVSDYYFSLSILLYIDEVLAQEKWPAVIFMCSYVLGVADRKEESNTDLTTSIPTKISTVGGGGKGMAFCLFVL